MAATVFVPRIDHPPAYAVARALKAGGFSVIGSASASWPTSTQIDVIRVIGDNAKQGTSIVESARAACANIVLPVAFADILEVSGSRSHLAECSIAAVAPSLQSLALAADKAETARLAERYGIPVPATELCRDGIRGAIRIRRLMNLPLVIKPITGSAAENVRLIRAWHGFEEELENAIKLSGPQLVQEYIPGGRERSINVLIGNDRTLLASFSLRKIRYLQPSRSTVIEVIEPLPETAAAIAMALGSGWCGFISFQTKYDERDQTNKLIEVNCRFGNNSRILLAMFPSIASALVASFLDQIVELPLLTVGSIGFAPLEDALSIGLYVYQRMLDRGMRYRELGNPLPSTSMLLKSFRDTYSRSPTRDFYTRALSDDFRVGVNYLWEHVLPQILPDTRAFIPWGEVVSYLDSSEESP